MLTLTAAQYRSIAAHAAQTYPEECCGLLLGTWQHPPDSTTSPTPDPASTPATNPATPPKICREVWPTLNAWTARDEELLQPPGAESALEPGRTSRETPHDRRDRFSIDPRELLTAQRYSRDRNWGIIGVYHSHPDHPAHPSERDRVAAWSQYSYLILSVAQGNTVDYRSWILDDQHQFQSEAVVVTPDP